MNHTPEECALVFLTCTVQEVLAGHSGLTLPTPIVNAAWEVLGQGAEGKDGVPSIQMQEDLRVRLTRAAALTEWTIPATKIMGRGKTDQHWSSVFRGAARRAQKGREGVRLYDAMLEVFDELLRRLGV